MDKKDERLWLKLDKMRKELYQIRYYYVATPDHDIITDMIKYTEILIKKLENNE